MQHIQFSSSSNVLFGLVILLGIGCLLQANAQMTFSDGWGKRSAAQHVASPFALLQHGGGSKRQSGEFGVGRGIVGELSIGDEAMNEAMDACHAGYAQRLVQLHEQMLTLYGNYQQCQAKAMAEQQPKTAGGQKA